jgi:hypothetical protein
MSGFTKLHSSLTASSIWNEPDSVRIVWITLLAMADSDGNVKAAVVGLAHMARKTLEETEAALDILLAPDLHSGRKEMEGRRIITIDGGWHLVTHEFYRELGMSEDAKRYWRERKRIQRMSKTVQDSPRQSRSVGDVLVLASDSVKGKKSTEKKGKPTEIQLEAFCESLGLPKSDGTATFLKWEGNGWTNNGKPVKSWKATIQNWKLQGFMPSQKPQVNSQGKAISKTKIDEEYEEAQKKWRLTKINESPK